MTQTLDYLSIIESESERFAELLESGPLDAPVTGCPGWTLNDLGAHLGDVQRWATGIIETGSPNENDYAPADADADLATWFRQGTAGLLAAFDAASPDDECWTLLGPGQVSFWHRRQALEAVVHRWDADDAANESAAPLAAAVGADAVDEWIEFRLRRQLARTDVDLTRLDGDVHFHCTDVAGEWTFEIADGELVVVDEHRKSAVAVKGTGSDLALFVYRRGDDSSVEVFGDRDLLDRWFTAIS